MTDAMNPDPINYSDAPEPSTADFAAALTIARDCIRTASDYITEMLDYAITNDHRSDDDIDYTDACCDLISIMTHASYADYRAELIDILDSIRTCRPHYAITSQTSQPCLHQIPLPRIPDSLDMPDTCPHDNY